MENYKNFTEWASFNIMIAGIISALFAMILVIFIPAIVTVIGINLGFLVVPCFFGGIIVSVIAAIVYRNEQFYA